MSHFRKMFSSNKGGAKPPTTSEAIQSLRETEDMLLKKQEFLEKKIQDELKTAKTNGTKNKRVALAALKRKKRFEKELQRIDGTLSTIEMQRETLESAHTNTNVLTNMGAAAKALKRAHQDLDVDKVHEMMDDIADQEDVAREISEAISNPVAFGQDVDEDDLLAELEELEQEALDEQLLDTRGAEARLPDIPTATPAAAAPAAAVPRKKVQEDDDMAELAAWAS